MVRSILTRFASVLPSDEDNDQDNEKQKWVSLTNLLGVPKGWIYLAKSFYSRSVNEYETELKYLIKAASWKDAHACLCQRVAPRLVIDENYQALRVIVSSFDRRAENVDDWARGGGVYADFIDLADLAAHEDNVHAGNSEQDKDTIWVRLDKLQRNLIDMGSVKVRGKGGLESAEMKDLEERVAIMEMGRKVAEMIMDLDLDLGVTGTNEKSKPKGKQSKEREELRTRVLLGLPITRDARMAVAVDMAAEHYRGVMAVAH